MGGRIGGFLGLGVYEIMFPCLASWLIFDVYFFVLLDGGVWVFSHLVIWGVFFLQRQLDEEFLYKIVYGLI